MPCAGNPKRAAKGVTARDRELRALELRKQGKTYYAIGQELGISESAAFYAVTRALDRMNAKIAESAAELRRLELERLDAMTSALAVKISRGSVPAIQTSIKIQERRARLLGLDAPAAQHITGEIGITVDIDAARAKLRKLLARQNDQPATSPADEPATAEDAE